MSAAAASPGAGVPRPVCSGAWPPAQRAAAAPGSPWWTCVSSGANDNGCGPISQPIWEGTPRPGSGRETPHLPGEAGMWGCWGALGCPCGPLPRAGVDHDSQRRASMLNSKSLLDSPVPVVTLIPIYEHRRTCGQLPALSIRKPRWEGQSCWDVGLLGPSVSPFAAFLTGPHLPGGRLLSTHSWAPTGCSH